MRLSTRSPSIEMGAGYHFVTLGDGGLHGCHVSQCCIVTRTHTDRCHPEKHGHTFGDRLKSLVQRTSVGALSSPQCVNAKRGTLVGIPPLRSAA